MRVQALRSQLAVKRLDEAVIGRFSRPREVQDDVGHKPKGQVAGDKFAAVFNPDRLGIASPLADTFQRLNHILTAIGEPCVGGGAVARMRIHNSQDAQFLTCRELVVNEIHRPYIVRTDGYLAVIPKLCIHPTLGAIPCRFPCRASRTSIGGVLSGGSCQTVKSVCQ